MFWGPVVPFAARSANRKMRRLQSLRRVWQKPDAAWSVSCSNQPFALVKPIPSPFPGRDASVSARCQENTGLILYSSQDSNCSRHIALCLIWWLNPFRRGAPFPSLRYLVGTNGSANPMTGWHQDFSLDASGTLTITKFPQERSVVRSTSNVISPKL